MAFVANATGNLPTLLTSRARGHEAAPQQQKKDRRPRPVSAIEIPEDEEAAPPGLCVRNTFIEAAVPMSPSLQPFYHQRSVQTCPGAQAGLLQDLFQESAYPGSIPTPAMAGFETQTPLAHVSSPAAYTSSAAPYAPHKPTADAPAKTVVSLATMLDLPGAFPAIAAPSHIAPPPTMPAPGSGELPSIGSALHKSGECKPCAFLYTKGCENGAMCSFCHLCDPEERKRRRQVKVEAQKTKRREMRASAQSESH